jgi:hypothetical protein
MQIPNTKHQGNTMTQASTATACILGVWVFGNLGVLRSALRSQKQNHELAARAVSWLGRGYSFGAFATSPGRVKGAVPIRFGSSY